MAQVISDYNQIKRLPNYDIGSRNQPNGFAGLDANGDFIGNDGAVNVKWFGAKGDGVTDDAAAIKAAADYALTLPTSAVYLGSGEYRISTPITIAPSKPFKFFGNNAKVLTNMAPVALSFSYYSTTNLVLSVDIQDDAVSLTVSDASGVAPGDIIRLFANTPVDSGYEYRKQAILQVSSVSGNVIAVSDPINFPFTVIEGTSVTAYKHAPISIEGIHFKQLIDSRVDFNAANAFMNNCVVECLGDYSGDLVFIANSYNFFAENISIIGGRYSVNCTGGSRNLYFNNINARNCRHPIDCNTWTNNTRITNLHGVNTQNSIQSHPCFEVHFENCTDAVNGQGGTGLRCIGGSVKNCTITSSNQTDWAPISGALLLPAYQYLGQKYDRHVEKLVSKTEQLNAIDVNALHVKNSHVHRINIDGVSNRVNRLCLDDSTSKVSSNHRYRRVRVCTSSPDAPYCDGVPDAFISKNIYKLITGITNSNPAVVTSVGHGLSDGDVVSVYDVKGMTQINSPSGNTQYYTVANATTDTFELAGVDSTIYGAYTAEGKAVVGKVGVLFDPTRQTGIPNHPSMRFRGLVVSSPIPLTAQPSVYTLRIRNVWEIQESPYRHIAITFKAHSRTDGCVIFNHQLAAFIGAPSDLTASAAQGMFAPVTLGLGSLAVTVGDFLPHFTSQVTEENNASDFVNNAPSTGAFYLSFEISVSTNSTNDILNRLEFEYEETASL